MKSVCHVVVVAIAFLASAAAHAASPREDLKQLTVQLQSNPSDTALREKIIKLAQQIKPIPAVPEEAQRRLGRGQAAFETAKEPPDFDKAIAEFNAAANVAPWLAAPYYNLGVAQEKAKKYREAMASFRLYLLAAPSAVDAGDVKQRLFKLEYLAEQPPSDEELLKRVNGARFLLANRHAVTDSRGEEFYEVSERQLVYGFTVRQLGPNDSRYNPDFLNSPTRFPPKAVYKGGLRWELPHDESCRSTPAGCFATTYTVSPDGRSLAVRYWRGYDGTAQTETYPRVN